MYYYFHKNFAIHFRPFKLVKWSMDTRMLFNTERKRDTREEYRYNKYYDVIKNNIKRKIGVDGYL